MKPIQVSQDILPLGEFKTHASKALRRVRESQRPIVITQNGRPAGVLLSPEQFDRLTERERFVTAVRDGLADAEAGRVLDDADLDAELARQLRNRDAECD
jgi:prevent-host-death family protein